MRYASLSAVAVAGLASLVAADVPFDPIYTPQNEENVPTCEPFTITWDPQPDKYVGSTIKLGLIGGPTQNTQVPLYDIAVGVPNSAGKYVWTPQASEYGKPFYGITAYLESDSSVMQYSNPFKLIAGNCGSAATTATPSPSPSQPAPPLDTHTATESPSLTKTVSLSYASPTGSVPWTTASGYTTLTTIPTAASSPWAVSYPGHLQSAGYVVPGGPNYAYSSGVPAVVVPPAATAAPAGAGSIPVPAGGSGSVGTADSSPAANVGSSPGAGSSGSSGSSSPGAGSGSGSSITPPAVPASAPAQSFSFVAVGAVAVAFALL